MSYNFENPKSIKEYEDEGVLHFTLQNIPICIANGLRRTILSDIPIVVIRTETSDINDCTIHANTSRFHNEIVKQRLSCVPIMTKDLEEFPEKYALRINVENNSDYEMRIVTSDDFMLQNKLDNSTLSEEETRKIFPHDELTDYPIEFLRLRPAIGSTVAGEKLSLTASMAVSTAKVNGMFNAVSKCAYHFVVDPVARDNLWSFHEERLKAEERSKEEIQFEKKNYQSLDAYRAFKSDANGNPTEIAFEVSTIGQYTNYEIVQTACSILHTKIETFEKNLKEGNNEIPIHESDLSKTLGFSSVVSSSMKGCYDVILKDEDYTLGFILEHYVYEMYFNKENGFKYIGFKKYHPHDEYSVLRLNLQKYAGAPVAIIRDKLTETCVAIKKTLYSLEKIFRR